MQEKLDNLSLINVNEAKESYEKDSADIKAAKTVLMSVIPAGLNYSRLACAGYYQADYRTPFGDCGICAKNY